MQTIDLQHLETVTGGTQTVSGAAKLDTATQQALTQLSSDIKGLTTNTTNSSSQMTQLMTMAMMMKMSRG